MLLSREFKKRCTVKAFTFSKSFGFAVFSSSIQRLSSITVTP